VKNNPFWDIMYSLSRIGFSDMDIEIDEATYYIRRWNDENGK